MGLVSDEGGAVATWTDTRLGDRDSGRQDVFATTVHGLGSSASPLWALIAGVAVLAGLVAWFVATRSTGSDGRQER